jgi:adenylate cyclase
MSDNNLITSKELMDKTGISRATLNNYIKMGILPKPIVRRPGPDQKGVKQIGYFPVSVLENIIKVKVLKRQGNTMDEIASMFQEGFSVDKEEPQDREVFDEHEDRGGPEDFENLEDITKAEITKDTDDITDFEDLEGRGKDEITKDADDFEDAEDIVDIEDIIKDREESIPKVRHPEKPAPHTPRRIATHELQVTIADISSPAYLINHNFEIEWINKPAEELIFNRDIKPMVDIESRNIFRLLLNEELRKDVSNWKEAVLLHLTILQKRISANNLKSLYEGVKESEINILAELFAEKSSSAREDIYHLPITINRTADNSSLSYWVHTMSFREGTFFVYVPTDSVNTGILDMLSHRDKLISELLKNRMPSLVSLCVLIADLQDSVKISAELLPAHYFELINELWQTVGPVFEKYKGIYGKHAGDGMLYYFIHRPGVNYLMNAVNCAIEIREVMKELSSKWKLRKGWDTELFLNTGINEGQEFFGTIQSSNNVEFTALGDSINFASRLSDLAQDGEIWTTKNLISRLTQDERNMIRFGVHQESQSGKIFIRNSFSRIGDIITKENPHYRHLSAIAGLPITEIKEKVYQSQAA